MAAGNSTASRNFKRFPPFFGQIHPNPVKLKLIELKLRLNPVRLNYRERRIIAEKWQLFRGFFGRAILGAGRRAKIFGSSGRGSIPLWAPLISNYFVFPSQVIYNFTLPFDIESSDASGLLSKKLHNFS